MSKAEIRLQESSVCEPGCQPGPSKRILVVDDDLFILRVNTALLRRFDYQTETAEDGAAAWEALQSNSYDLLLTDNNMPKITGVELIAKARSARLTLPVILASGQLPAQELERSPWLQPVATLVKPFTGDQLLATVKHVLREVEVACGQIEPLPTFRQGEFGHRAQLPRLPTASLVR